MWSRAMRTEVMPSEISRTFSTSSLSQSLSRFHDRPPTKTVRPSSSASAWDVLDDDSSWAIAWSARTSSSASVGRSSLKKGEDVESRREALLE